MSLPLTLSERGFRLVWSDGAWVWRHPGDVTAEDIDTSEMTDEEFEQMVRDLT